MSGLRTVLLALARSDRVRSLAVGWGPTRRVVDRFIAGETASACLDAVRGLVADGLLVSVDHLGESTSTRAQAERITVEYARLLALVADAGLADSVEVSVKLTALGLGLPGGREIALANARTVCAAASAAGTTVTVDMEDHTVTEVTLGIVAELRRDFPGTGAVLQAALRRTPQDCRALAGPGSRVRLCKGAYAEPPEVAVQGSDEVRAAYLTCLEVLMAGQGYPMVASHDPAIIAEAGRIAERAGRTATDVEFQMLYGIRSDEQRRLAALGHRVRVYVPYGTDWWAYFMRRLAERPANLAFFLRAVAGG